MTRKERVLKAINGEKVDRVPVNFTMHFGPQFRHGDPAVMMHLDYANRTQVDLLKIMNENYYRCDTRILCADDFKHIRPMAKDSKPIQDQLYIIKKIADAIGDEVATCVTTFGVLSSSIQAINTHIKDKEYPDGMGGGTFETDGFKLPMYCRQKPEVMKAALKIIGESLAENLCAYVDAGADGIFYSVMGSGQNVFTSDEYDTFIGANDKPVFDALKDKAKIRMIHVCKTYADLTKFTNYGANVFNWGAHTEGCPSLEEGRKIFGPEATILGGLDDRDGVLYSGSMEELKKATFDVLDEMGDRHFIFGADCSIASWVSYDKLRACVGFCEEYAQNK